MTTLEPVDSCINLVVADGQPITLQALERVFRAEQQFKIRALGMDGPDVLQALRTHRPDVFIFGLDLGRKDGLAVLREIRQETTSPHAILVTDGLEETHLLEALRLGVRGIVHPEMPAHLLAESVRTVYAGQQWLARVSVRHLLDKLLRLEAGRGFV